MAFVTLSEYIKLQNENNTLKQKLNESTPNKLIRNKIKELEKVNNSECVNIGKKMAKIEVLQDLLRE